MVKANETRSQPSSRIPSIAELNFPGPTSCKKHSLRKWHGAKCISFMDASERQRCVSGCKGRIQGDRLLEEPVCLLVVWQICLTNMPEAALICLPCSKVFRWFAQCPPLFGITNSRPNGLNYRKRDLVLHCKYIFRPPVVALCQM